MITFRKIKIYEVEFLNYTDVTKTTVYSELYKQYVDVGKEPFLISEDQMEYYQQFGGGFRNLIFVGWTDIPMDSPQTTEEIKNSEEMTQIEIPNDEEMAQEKEEE